MSCNSLTVAQIPFQVEHRSILCNFVAKNAVNADWSILVYATKLQCDMHSCILQLWCAIMLHDKIAI